MTRAGFTREEVLTRNEIPKPREPRSEILDRTTGEIWQACEPHSRAWLAGLDLGDAFRKVGYAAGHFDRHWFRRSPDGAVDGPLRTREFGGRRFFFCARQPTDVAPGPPLRMLVDKHHTLEYSAGRDVQLLRGPDGREFALATGSGAELPSPTLPQGWSLRTITLGKDWLFDLPAPTETYWFDGFVSYQGPVEPPC